MSSFVSGVIKNSRANVVNVREDASITAPILRTLRVGDSVCYKQMAVVGGEYTVAGTKMSSWFQLNTGFVAAGVVTISTEVLETPLRLLNVPFVSQIDSTSKRTNNDCGVACALMVIQHRLLIAGMRVMRALTVDRLVNDTPLAHKDAPLTLSAVSNLLEAYGLNPKIMRPLNSDAIVKSIDDARPCILLVNYRHIGTGNFGHYVVAHGYSENNFWIHDPYKEGANKPVSREKLEQALTDVSDFAAFPYQGIVAS
jgi:hypothetical protein